MHALHVEVNDSDERLGSLGILIFTCQWRHLLKVPCLSTRSLFLFFVCIFYTVGSEGPDSACTKH